MSAGVTGSQGGGCTRFSPPRTRLMRDGPEGDRVAGPGERLELDSAAAGRGGHHGATALVDAHVVHVAARVTGVVEEHQVARPGCGAGESLEMQELLVGGAADDLAPAGLAVDVLAEA